MFQKLNVSFDPNTRNVTYHHPNQTALLNDWIGSSIVLTILEKTTCLGCHQPKKILRGFCFLCSKKLARCDQCFLNPHLCHFLKGTCREPQWAEDVCNKPHVLYLALSSHPKIGITRSSQIPIRWIDQGACWSKILGRTESRREAGLIEKKMHDNGWKGQTLWRDLLLGKTSVPIETMPQLFRDAQKAAQDIAREINIPFHVLDCDDKIFQPIYPGMPILKKASSLKFPGFIEDVLIGIKGQYLFFEEKGAVNIRNYEGYEVFLEKR